MTINFDEIINRRGTYASKWDVKENELPLSIADMDFKAAPEIVEALQKRVEHGIYGYTDVSDKWYESIINWWEKRHGIKFAKEDLLFCTGVIPAISSLVRKLTTPAEKVLVLTPVYNIFFNSIYNNGRYILECPLKDEDGNYHIDFADLETKLADPQTTLMILCNPHNPVGRIWSKDELAQIAHLCKKNHVIVISDEIHCDLVDPHEAYVPFAKVSDEAKYNSVTCIAPSKAFNLAGLQSSAIVVFEEGLRNRVRRAINTDEVAEPNAFAMTATETAFSQCGYWLDELMVYIKHNKDLIRSYIRDNIPELRVIPSKATYLLWIDCRKISNDSVALAKYIREKSGLILADGSIYRGDGNYYLRMNTAYPKQVIEDALKRLSMSIEAFKKER